jgi:hypothetical protein
MQKIIVSNQHLSLQSYSRRLLDAHKTSFFANELFTKGLSMIAIKEKHNLVDNTLKMPQ